MKNKIILFLIFLININLNADEVINKFEILDHDGKYNEALDLLIKSHEKDNNNLTYIWRIGLTTFEITNSFTDNKKKIEYFDIGIKYLKPYIALDSGDKRDRAEIIHWYSINYASKLKIQGILAGRESIQLIPKIMKYMDQCLELEPTYGGAYFFKAKVTGDVPFFLGGDKILMEEYFKKSFDLANTKEKLVFYVGAAESFLQRNWTFEYKKTLIKNNKLNINNLISFSYSDKDYAIYLLNEAINIYKSINDPAVRDTGFFNKANSMLYKIK